MTDASAVAHTASEHDDTPNVTDHARPLPLPNDSDYVRLPARP